MASRSVLRVSRRSDRRGNRSAEALLIALYGAAVTTAADLGNHFYISSHTAGSRVPPGRHRLRSGVGEIVAASADARVRHLASPSETF
jgi:hypothetical protein